MIKAVLFDIDGVLLDSFEANLKFYQNLMFHAGYSAPSRESFIPIFPLSMIKAIEALVPSAAEAEIKRVWELGKNRDVAYPLDLLKTPDGAEDIIKQLNQSYLLGIVTSRIRTSVYEAPQLAKLQKYFREVVSYEDTTNHKPDPEPLLMVAKKLSVTVEQCVYIGDAESDVIAARAAGMKIIIYSTTQPFPEADATVTSFKELPGLIATL